MLRILIMFMFLLLLMGCSDAQRTSTVHSVYYESNEVTVMFKDGIVITTHLYDEGLEPGDKAQVIHKNNGDVEILRQ